MRPTSPPAASRTRRFHLPLATSADRLTVYVWSTLSADAAGAVDQAVRRAVRGDQVDDQVAAVGVHDVDRGRAVDGALPVTPETVIALVTAVPASGMLTSSMFSNVPPGRVAAAEVRGRCLDGRGERADLGVDAGVAGRAQPSPQLTMPTWIHVRWRPGGTSARRSRPGRCRCRPGSCPRRSPRRDQVVVEPPAASHWRRSRTAPGP